MTTGENMNKPNFEAGKNIALKVPSHEFEAAVRFYRETLGFKTIEELSDNSSESVVFEFGDKNLWLDKTPGISQAEIWLEITTDNMEMAAAYLQENDCARCDEIEALPPGFKGFWISNPANIIHLIQDKK